MNRLVHIIKRLALPLCLTLCVAALATGVYALTGSGRQITTSLHKVDGDIAGIDSLRITGEVEDADTGLSYVFVRNGEDGVPVRLDPWDHTRSGSDDYRPVVDETRVTLRPVSGLREVIMPELQDQDGVYEDYYWARRRVYADVFEAIPLIPLNEAPVRLDPGAEKLYYDGEPDTYLAYDMTDEADEYVSQYPYVNVGTVSRWAMLPSNIAVGDKLYFAPAYDGLYGMTAVYVLTIPQGDMEMDPEYDYPAQELLPIRLVKGVDEICGFLTCEDALLLAVRHGDEIELTRLRPEGGAFPSVRIPAQLDLEQPLKNDALMLFTSRTSAGLYTDYRVLDTSAMQIVASGDNARIGGGQRDSDRADLFTPHAFWLADEALYIGSDEMIQRIPDYDYRRRLYVTALSLTGRRLGCAEVMMGLADDPELPYAPTNRYFSGSRILRTLELSDGGFYD